MPRKWRLTIFFALTAIGATGVAIIAVNQILGNLVEDEPTRAIVLRTTTGAMGGLFIVLSGFIVAADKNIYTSNIRDIAMVEAQLEQREQESRAKTQILSTVSHELKTPLTSILSQVQIMLRQQDRVGALSERQQRCLNLHFPFGRHHQSQRGGGSCVEIAGPFSSRPLGHQHRTQSYKLPKRSPW